MAQFPVGSMVWARLTTKDHPWPGIVVQENDAGLKPEKGKSCMFWITDKRVSMISNKNMEGYKDAFKKYHNIGNIKLKEAIAESIQMQMERSYNKNVSALTYEQKCESIMNVSPNTQEIFTIPESVCYTLKKVKELNISKYNTNEEEDIEDSYTKKQNFYNKIKGEDIDLTDYCLLCYTCDSSNASQLKMHPFFKGGLCLNCFRKYKSKLFIFDPETKRKAFCLLCGEEEAENWLKENCMWAFCELCVELGTGALKNYGNTGILKKNRKRRAEYIFNIYSGDMQDRMQYQLSFSEDVNILYLSLEDISPIQDIEDNELFRINYIHNGTLDDMKKNLISLNGYHLIIAKPFGEDDVWYKINGGKTQLYVLDKYVEFFLEFYKLTYNSTKKWIFEMPAAVNEDTQFLINRFLNTTPVVIRQPHFGNKYSPLNCYRFVWSNIQLLPDNVISLYYHLLSKF